MRNLLISGWNYGFEKVEFTRLMKRELGLTLKPAKQITDRIMEGDHVKVQVPDAQVEHLLAAMTDLGARCEATVAQHSC